MPIRAQLDGHDIIPPLGEKEWENLQERSRSKKIELRLPCCGGLAYPRTSPRGAQHFVHFTNSGCTPESELHLLAKLEIIKVCRRLGYDAIPEFVGDGWRADVLVRSAKWTCCFEVQVSQQSFQETVRRQAIYQDHGLRCCWLFSELPERQALRLQQLPLLSQYATPMFQLREVLKGYRSQFDVEVNGNKRSLDQFVEDLLRKKLRYSRSRADGGIKSMVELWKTACPQCGFTMHFFHLADLQGQTVCGAKVSLAHNRFSLLYPEFYKRFFDFYMKGIPSEIREFLRVETHEGQPYYEFVCTGCGQTRLSEMPPSSRSLKNLSALEFNAGSEGTAEIALDHWCDSPLCRPVTSGSAGEIQDVLSIPDLRWKCTAIRRFERKIDYQQRLPYRQYISYTGQS